MIANVAHEKEGFTVWKAVRLLKGIRGPAAAAHWDLSGIVRTAPRGVDPDSVVFVCGPEKSNNVAHHRILLFIRGIGHPGGPWIDGDLGISGCGC